MDSHQKIGYVCLGKHVGFDIVNLQTGKVLDRVYAGAEHIPHRTHGSALTPDETELWISDQVGKKLFIFDATTMPPTAKGQVELSQGATAGSRSVLMVNTCGPIRPTFSTPGPRSW